MNIAIVSAHRFIGYGGMETVIPILMRELTKRGDSVVLISRQGSNPTGWADGLSYYEICSCGGVKVVLYCWQLTKLLSSIKPDIILAVDRRAVYYSRLYRWLRAGEVRLGSWIHSSLSIISKRKASKLKYADFHLAISSGIANDIRNYTNSPSEHIYRVYNPTPFVNEMIPRPPAPVFLYMGRLVYEKDKKVNDFLQALSKVKGFWKALIVGDGPDVAQLKRMSQELGIASNITWTGWKNEPWNIDAASVLVLTSQHEAFPLVLIEALNRGIPCISSNYPDGPKDIIEHGKNGWLYPVGDIDELTKLMQMIVDGYEALPDQVYVKDSGAKFATEAVIDNIRRILLMEVEKLHDK